MIEPMDKIAHSNLIYLLEQNPSQDELTQFFNQNSEKDFNQEIILKEGIALSPLDYALLYNEQEILKIILEKGISSKNKKFASPVATLIRQNFKISDWFKKWSY